MRATTSYEINIESASSYCWTGYGGTQVWLTMTEDREETGEHEVLTRCQIPKDVAVKMAQRILEQVEKEENSLLEKGELAMSDALLGDPETHPDFTLVIEDD